jgi:hypothetical protein
MTLGGRQTPSRGLKRNHWHHGRRISSPIARYRFSWRIAMARGSRPARVHAILRYLASIYPADAMLITIMQNCQMPYNAAQEICRQLYAEEGAVSRHWRQGRWWYRENR